MQLEPLEPLAMLSCDLNGDAVVDAGDIDFVAERAQMGALRPDLNADGLANRKDHNALVEIGMDTYLGDSNLDGEFDSGDLVKVFRSAEYEDGRAGNSTWETGDWDGNGEFDSTDLVVVFERGAYEQGPRQTLDEAADTLIEALDLESLDRSLTIQQAIGVDRNCEVDEVDVYRFTVDEPSEVTATISGLTNVQTCFSGCVSFRLLQDGNRNGLFDSDEALEGNNTARALTIKEDVNPGVYYLHIRRTAPGVASRYTIDLSSAPLTVTNATDPGDLMSPTDIGTLSDGPSLIRDVIGAVDAVDVYEFSIDEPSEVNATISGLTNGGGCFFGCVEFQLLQDENLNGVFDQGETLELVTAVMNGTLQEDLIAGTYQLQILRTVFGVGTRYTLTVNATALPVSNEVDPGDLSRPAELGTLTDDRRIIDDLVGARDEEDTYEFEIDVPSQVIATISGLTNGGSCFFGCVEFQLIQDVNEDGVFQSEELLESVRTIASGTLDEDLVAGTYQLRIIRTVFDVSTRYTLSARAVTLPIDNAVDPGDLDSPVNIGTVGLQRLTINDAIGALDESDVYQFSLDQPGLVTATISGLTDGMSCFFGCFQLELGQDVNGDEVLDQAEVLASGKAINMVSIQAELAEGIYQLRITRDVFQLSSRYALTVAAKSV